MLYHPSPFIGSMWSHLIISCWHYLLFWPHLGSTWSGPITAEQSLMWPLPLPAYREYMILSDSDNCRTSCSCCPLLYPLTGSTWSRPLYHCRTSLSMLSSPFLSTGSMSSWPIAVGQHTNTVLHHPFPPTVCTWSCPIIAESCTYSPLVVYLQNVCNIVQ
jgi:hypothetical protein